MRIDGDVDARPAKTGILKGCWLATGAGELEPGVSSPDAILFSEAGFEDGGLATRPDDLNRNNHRQADQQPWAAMCASTTSRACSDFTRLSFAARFSLSYSSFDEVPVFR